MPSGVVQGQGSGGGAGGGQGGGSGQGGGRGGGFRPGPGGSCLCPACGHKEPHRKACPALRKSVRNAGQ